MRSQQALRDAAELQTARQRIEAELSAALQRAKQAEQDAERSRAQLKASRAELEAVQVGGRRWWQQCGWCG